MQAGAYVGTEYRTDKLLADYVCPVLRAKGIPCNSGFHFDRGSHVWHSSLVDHVFVCVAAVGDFGKSIPENGVRVFMGNFFRLVRAMLRTVVFLCLFYYRFPWGKPGKRRPRGICLVGGGNSHGFVAWSGKFYYYACIIPSDYKRDEKGQALVYGKLKREKNESRTVPRKGEAVLFPIL